MLRFQQKCSQKKLLRRNRKAKWFVVGDSMRSALIAVLSTVLFSVSVFAEDIAVYKLSVSDTKLST